MEGSKKIFFMGPSERVFIEYGRDLARFWTESCLPLFLSTDKTCLIVRNDRHFNPFESHKDASGRSKDHAPGGIQHAVPP